MSTITRTNDLLTNHIITLIREYETEHDTNCDITVVYGHFANSITFNTIYDKHGENIGIDIDGTQSTTELLDILYSILQ